MSNDNRIKSLNRDFFSKLSDDLLLEIFYYIDHPLQLFTYRLVCKKWYKISRDSILWRMLYIRDFSRGVSISKKGISILNRKRAKRFSGLLYGNINWEKLYIRNFCWTYGPLDVKDIIPVPLLPPLDNDSGKVLKQFKEKLVTILDSKVFICMNGIEILCLSLTDGEYLGSVNIHSVKERCERDVFQINCIEAYEKEKVLALGFSDGTLELHKIKKVKAFSQRIMGPQAEDKSFCPNFELILRLPIDSFQGLIYSEILEIRLLDSYLSILRINGELELWKINYSSYILKPTFNQCIAKKIYYVKNNSYSRKPVSIFLYNSSSSLFSGNEYDLTLIVYFDVIGCNNTHEIAMQVFSINDSSIHKSEYHRTIDYSSEDEKSDEESSIKNISFEPIYHSLVTSAVTCLICSYQGELNYLITGHTDHTINIWFIKGSGISHFSTLIGHTGAITCLAADLSDSSRLVSGSNDRQVKIWSLVTGECLLTLNGHDSPLSNLVNKESLRLISGDIFGRWKLWCFDS